MTPDPADDRIPVILPVSRELVDGLDVEFTFAGNYVSPRADGPPPRMTGTLMCSRADGDSITVRLVTNQPLEDRNGQEIHQLDLDQSSVDSLHQRDSDGGWTLCLPD
ncbi:MAG: hypothetical protein EOP88_23120, partial [Verrucomicrobiaceae bacterium]